MAVALAPSRSEGRPRRVGGWLPMVGRLKERQQTGGFIRLATAAAVGCSIALPLLELARIAAGWTPSPGHAPLALVATACYLPLYVRHVWHAARGSRPAGAGWTLLAMAVVILGALPFIGTSWLISLHSLAVSVLIIVAPPWSLLAAAGLVAATAPLAVAFGHPQWAAFYIVSVIWRGAAVFVLVWLVGAARRLEHARLLLAEEALARERLRIDGELRRTLGAALEAIAARGRRAACWPPGMPRRWRTSCAPWSRARGGRWRRPGGRSAATSGPRCERSWTVPRPCSPRRVSRPGSSCPAARCRTP